MERAAVTVSQQPSVVFRDGLGERRQTSDPSGADAIELLCLRSDLAAVPSFEFALRERVSRLGNFRHAYYGRVRGVERANDRDQTLTVSSDATAGLRLSDLLARTEERRVPLDINAALCLIRQLVPAVAMLHENAKDVAHGALGPERLVITPNARLVIVEYVLGAALEQLRYSQERYWSELRVALPKSPGLPRFDQRTDVTQMGVVALSLILGRSLREDEYPARVGDVVAATWAVSPRGGFEPLPPGLRGWLTRALQLDPRSSFASAIDARIELDKVLGDSDYIASPASLESFLTRYHAAERPTPRIVTSTAAPSAASSPAFASPAPTPTPAPPPAPPPVARPVAAAPVSPAHAPSVVLPAAPTPVAAPNAPFYPTTMYAPAAQSPAAQPAPISAPAPVAPMPRPMAAPVPAASSLPTQPVAAAPSRPAPAPAPTPIAPPAADSSILSRPFSLTPDETASAHEPAPLFEMPVDPSVFDAPQPSRSKRWIWGGVAAGVVILAMAGVAASRFVFGQKPAPVETGTLVITTNPPGAEAMVDGQPKGMTPLTLSLSAGQHNVELRGSGLPRTIPVTITAGAEVAQYVDLPKAADAVGQLQVKSEPSGAKVSVDGQVRGVAPLTILALTPGEHIVTLDSDLGSVKQTVTIESGATASLVVPLGASPAASPASGWVNITAPFDVQVIEAGRVIGTSQSDRIMVTAGRHDIELVNDTLGYRSSKSVQVPAGKVASVAVDVPKGTIAVNAVPWAEVWIDGEKIGETPIGNYAIAIGNHDVLFRHPDFGEQHYTATVGLKNPARLSVDLRKK